MSDNQQKEKDIFLEFNPFQKDVIDECISRKNGWLVLSLGEGKTLIALDISLKFQKMLKEKNKIEPILIIVELSLIDQWKNQIAKYDKNLKVEILYKRADDWILYPETQIVLSTPETAGCAFKKNKLEQKFTYESYKDEDLGNRVGNVSVGYKLASDTLIKEEKTGHSMLFSKKWSCLIIDEGQNYTNLGLGCKALSAICAEHRWVLSGTPIGNPTVERVLGFHMLINAPDFPRTLPLAKLYLNKKKKACKFKGLEENMVYRDPNPDPDIFRPKANKTVIEHTLTLEESFVYRSLIEILSELMTKKKKQQAQNNITAKKSTEGCILALIGYLRQCVICPYKLVLDIQNKGPESEIYYQFQKIVNEDSNKHIKDWISNKENIKSTRIKEALKIIKNHIHEKIIVFSCFRIYLEILGSFIKGRKVFTIKPTMSPEERGQVINEFSNDKDGVMLLTYDIGAEGLNLQEAHNVIMLDYWWSADKTKQAIGRILRYGQKSPEVNIYFCTSNAGIENCIFTKHKDKLNVLDELLHGPASSSVKPIPTEQIVNMLIDAEMNKNLIKTIHINENKKEQQQQQQEQEENKND